MTLLRSITKVIAERKRQGISEPLTYPENLYCVVFEKSTYSDIPSDWEVSVAEVLKFLNPREACVIQARYKDGMTLDSTGEIALVGVSRERVRQIEKKALRKLRHPVRSRLLTEGVTIMEKVDKYEAESLLSVDERIYNAKKKAIDDRIAELDAALTIEGLSGVDVGAILGVNCVSCFSRSGIRTFAEFVERAKAQIEGREHALLIRDTVLIENMNLSVRAYNCLKCAGIDTLADLSEKTENNLMRVRNLGRKSYEEILEKMAQYGVYLRSE